MVENLPVKQQMWVIYLGWECPLEKEMTNLSSILAWRIPMDREDWQLKSIGSQRVRQTEQLSTEHEIHATRAVRIQYLCH